MIYEDAAGGLDKHLVSRDDEATLEIAETGRPWSFDGDGELLRLVSEAYRIKLARLFDPYVAITTSLVEPLPHQISAVYETMLERLPLRFLLADDPGAGKTIMAGLLVKELMLRGALGRCLLLPEISHRLWTTSAESCSSCCTIRNARRSSSTSRMVSSA